MVQRAIRHGWEVPQATAHIVPRRLLHIFNEKRQPRPGQPPLKGSDRYKQPVDVQIKIAEVVLAMEIHNAKLAFAEAEISRSRAAKRM